MVTTASFIAAAPCSHDFFETHLLASIALNICYLVVPLRAHMAYELYASRPGINKAIFLV